MSLKMEWGSRLDSWMVPAWRCSWTCGFSSHGALKTRRGFGLDLWIIPAWSLKNKEVFWIELVDCPAFCSRSAPRRALKMDRCSKSDPNVLFSFLTQCYYPHTLRQSVSPVCRIFVTANLHRVDRLDSVGLIDNKPYTDKHTNFVKKKCDM